MSERVKTWIAAHSVKGHWRRTYPKRGQRAKIDKFVKQWEKDLALAKKK